MNKMSIFKTVVLSGLTVVLLGCSTFDKNNGSRVEHNSRQQTIDQYAGYEESVEPLDGVKAGKALDNYRTEKSEAPTERLMLDVGE